MKKSYPFSCYNCGHEQQAKPSLMMKMGINHCGGNCLKCGKYLSLEIEGGLDGDRMISDGLDLFRSKKMNEELLNTIVKILIILESSGDPNAVNESEAAVGILQIRPIMMEDVSRIIGWDVELLDYPGKDEYADARLNPVFSGKVCKAYLRHYMRSLKAKGLPDVFYIEYAARIWNGGPTGHKKTCTKGYGKRAKRIFHIIQTLERIEKLGLFACADKMP